MHGMKKKIEGLLKGTAQNPGNSEKEPAIYYMVEEANWSIKQDGLYITENVERLFNVKSRIITSHKGIRNKILHFGSRGLYLPNEWKNIHQSNKIVFTWFHGSLADPDPGNLAMIKSLPSAAKKADLVHVTNPRTRKRLVEWGIPRDKIVEIPLGVDLNLFRPATQSTREKARKEIGIPGNCICIGSFQKDGVGWGQGNKPKMVKGPDIFCDAVIELSKTHPVYVLLIGPARGYVKKRLRTARIPFHPKYLENFQDVAKYYQALDLYLVTSRDEGGPKAILEAMASGTPLVTTRVGMASRMVKQGKNGFLAGIENTGEIVEFASGILDSPEETRKIVSNAIETAKAYSWENTAKAYYKKMYSRLLEEQNAGRGRA